MKRKQSTQCTCTGTFPLLTFNANSLHCIQARRIENYAHEHLHSIYTQTHSMAYEKKALSGWLFLFRQKIQMKLVFPVHAAV